ncbi:helix-turn-helix transcriptional regulator [Paraburkholderia sp. SOS3]|jgi:AraC-like DNA-binding protein|uniref:helix-turn-helix transcriptional regulator n=1 Tax=Paraburkholderia sp. SOS3 TaxID=1926494 RepID=UPI0009473E1F|nr:helix-turn-helix domain-containing protein [Paraburkholderia sp. SOS3]APR38321.1 AraC family transcriptional regulator [Paraburkholderia sp. SOS3]
MSSTLYFAVTSALSSAHAAASFSTKMLAGQFHDAAAVAAARVDHERPDDAPSQAELQAYADVQLVLGRYEDAEETYRLAQKAMRGERSAIRAALCRNAGWQALFQNHLGTALMCFKRIADDDEASNEQRLESLVGAALVLFHLGRLDGVRKRLEAMSALAALAPDFRWRRLVDTLRHDLLVQYRLRSTEPLADHIYWQSVIAEFMPAHVGDGMPTLADDSTPAIAVLTRRIDYLHHLQALARGSHAALGQIDAHLRWSQSAGLDDYHRSLRLEVALGALAGKAPHVAETMLHMFRDSPMQGVQHARWYLEYLYCQAKVRQQQGRLGDHAQWYGRYALMSIRHVRADSVALPATPAEQTQPAPDDISARLPGKYRRAYRYLVDNLERADLSVRDVATHIGVTDRALQAAFKAHLGVSPSELIRNKRMEHIREELMVSDSHSASVLQIANRWGVQHRSTLLNGYRKMFKEAPSETLSR